jgi:hypothetical protein
MGFLGSSQSIEVLSFDDHVIGDAWNSNAIYAYASVQNISDVAVSVKVRRIDGNYNDLTDFNAICWGSCYPPETSDTPDAIILEPGQIDSLHFTAHVFPDEDGIPLTGPITYEFYNSEDDADMASITVLFEVEVSSDIAISDPVEIEVYPNPATDVILVLSDRSFSGELYDLAGKLWLSFKNEQKVAVHEFPRGVYILQMLDDTGSVKSHRMVLN